MNSIGTTGKIEFAMSVANESVLEFLDLSLHINEQSLLIFTLSLPITLLITLKNNLPLLYSDPNMRAVFPEGSVNVTYRRGKNLKELIS